MKTLVLMMFAGTMLSSAASIDLYQAGWDAGGPLHLSFSGNDVDANGSLDVTELTSFNAVFDLGPGQSISWSLSDISSDGFSYGPANNFFLRADNGAGDGGE